MNLTSFGPIPKKVTFKVTYGASKSSHVVKKKPSSKHGVYEKTVPGDSEKNVATISMKVVKEISDNVIKDVSKKEFQSGSEKVIEKVVKDVHETVVKKSKKLKSKHKSQGVFIKEIHDEVV